MFGVDDAACEFESSFEHAVVVVGDVSADVDSRGVEDGVDEVKFGVESCAGDVGRAFDDADGGLAGDVEGGVFNPVDGIGLVGGVWLGVAVGVVEVDDADVEVAVDLHFLYEACGGGDDHIDEVDEVAEGGDFGVALDDADVEVVVDGDGFVDVECEEGVGPVVYEACVECFVDGDDGDVYVSADVDDAAAFEEDIGSGGGPDIVGVVRICDQVSVCDGEMSADVDVVDFGEVSVCRGVSEDIAL